MDRHRKRRRKGCLISALLIFIWLLIFLGAVWLLKSGKLRDLVASVENIPYQEDTVKEVIYQEDTSEEDASENYYYEQLSEDEQLIYREIWSGLDSNTEEIYLHADNADRVNEILQYVMKDHPEIFWCDGSATATSYTGATSYTILKPTYQYDADTRNQMQQQIDAVVEEWLSGISSDTSDYEKILYVYEQIINQVEYNLEASDNQNIYSVFVGHESVCAGYAKATQYLLNKLGIFCTYIVGTAGDENQTHAWNLVKCAGEYYYVDTTWGDPTFLAEEGEEVNASEKISYDYMLCDDTELLKNHTPDGSVELPSCTHMDYNYYVVNGVYYTSFDADSILQKMNDLISAGGNPTVIKFANSELYQSARDSIFQDTILRAAENLANWYGISEVKYQYLDEPDLNKITIYWQYQ